MGQAIGQSLPFAIGVAISPVPIIAIILMLLSSRAGANSAAFLGGWFVGVTGAAVVLLVVASGAGAGDSGGPSTTAGIVKLVLGLAALALAIKNLRNRPGPDGEAELPGWLKTIQSITPVKSLGLGVLLSALNPKNLLMIAGGMAVIGPLGLSTSDATVAVAVFVLIAISTVLAPVIVYRVAGQRAERILDGLRDWLARENAVVMGVLLLVIGVVLVGQAIATLA